MARVVSSAAINTLRDSNRVLNPATLQYELSTLLELASTNLCLQSENFGTTWAAIGSPTRTAAATTAIGVTLDLLGDDDAAGLEGYSQTITFTGDAVKAVSCFVKQGSSTSSAIVLRDTSAGADRLLGVLTWSGGLPVVTMTTGTYFGYLAYTDSQFRLLFATTSVTAANTNSLRVYPATDAALATTATGTLYVGGVQCGDALVPSSYNATTTASVTRAVDVASTTFSAPPQETTFYVKFIERGTSLISGARLIQLSESGGAANSFRIDRAASDRYAARLADAAEATTSSSTATVTPAYGNLVELRVTVSATGVVQLHQTINAGSEVSATAGGVGGLPAQWGTGTAKLWLGSRNGASAGAAAFLAVKSARGTKTLAEMRAYVA